jgi:hypothetical protein
MFASLATKVAGVRSLMTLVFRLPSMKNRSSDVADPASVSAAVAKAAEAKGQKVIMGKEAKELMPHEYSTPKGYKLLDDREFIGKTRTEAMALRHRKDVAYLQS